MKTKSSKVSIVGAGDVGSTVANAIVLRRVCDSIMLFDRTPERAEGEAWDIEDSIPLLSEIEIQSTGEYSDLQDSDIIIITVGAIVKPGTSRLEVLGTNAGIIASIVRELDQVAKDAILMVVSNPVDVLTRIVLDTSTRPENLIFGSGTVLDTSRMRYQLGKHLNVDDQEIHLYIIGEHGSSEFPVWTSATIGSFRLEDFPIPKGTVLIPLQSNLTDLIRERGGAIHKRKGCTNYGIAIAVTHIVDCILKDEKRILPVSVRPRKEYGIGSDVVLSLPCILGKSGVERQLLLPLSQDEQSLLQKSATVLNEAYESLKKKGNN
jgi:L-lactate dehydrogenase